MKQRFARLISIGDEPRDQARHEMGEAAVAAVLDPGAIFEWIAGRLHDRALGRQALIEQRQKTMVPVLWTGAINSRPLSKRA